MKATTFMLVVLTIALTGTAIELVTQKDITYQPVTYGGAH
jgi:hypothetical protein